MYVFVFVCMYVCLCIELYKDKEGELEGPMITTFCTDFISFILYKMTLLSC